MAVDLRFADYFLFTQHSLSTFDSCPLKFKRRYLENLKWDSFPEETVRKQLQKGNDFHLLAQRYFLGVDPGLHDGVQEYEELAGWLEQLRNAFPLQEGVQYLPEYRLRMVSPELKLEANIDLVTIQGNKVEIWDWKTHGGMDPAKRTREEKRLRSSLQTMVYMFVVWEQLELVAGGRKEDYSLSMHYWTPDPPHPLADIRYSCKLHEDFRSKLQHKIRHILSYDFADFDQALYQKNCQFCEFNWYCNNRSVDSEAIHQQDDFLESFDWDSLEEMY